MHKKLSATLALMSCLMLVGCISPSNNNSSENTTHENETTKVCVVCPTKKGQKYLKQNSLKSYIDIRRDDEDKSYHMVIDSSAFEIRNVSFYDEVGGYVNDGIDVQLFGIGTNFDNSSTANTVLYASVDEEPTETADIDLKDQMDDDESAEIESSSEESSNDEKSSEEIIDNSEDTTESEEETRDLVTGVEYVYGTGPLRNEVDVEQNVWIKTTVMEYSSARGAYIASKDIEPTYTSVFIELKDTVAPEVQDVTYTISYSDYAAMLSKDQAINDWLSDIIIDKILDTVAGTVNVKETPVINTINISNPKDKYDPGDTISGVYTAKDSSGNVSIEHSFAITLYKDFHTDDIINVPYREITENDNDYREAYLKEKVLSAFLEWPAVESEYYYNAAGLDYRNSLTTADVTLTNFDDEYIAELLDLKTNITEQRECILSAKIGEYGTFSYSVILKDFYAPDKWWAGRGYDWNDIKNLDDLAAAYMSDACDVQIIDDFEDTYTLLITGYYSKTDKLTCFDVYIEDSSKNTRYLDSDGSKKENCSSCGDCFWCYFIDLVNYSTKKLEWRYPFVRS